MKRAILFANGEYSNPEFYREILDDSDYIVAIDGGLNFLDLIGVKPDLLIGDFDSVDREVFDKYTDVETIKHPSVKDQTDTEIALEEVIKRGYINNITLAGVMGKRTDHMLSNLLLLEAYAREGINLSIISPEESIVCLQGPSEIMTLSKVGTTISLIPLTDVVEGIELSGFSYPLEKATLEKIHPGHGVSNEASEEIQTIKFKSGILLIIVEK